MRGLRRNGWRGLLAGGALVMLPSVARAEVIARSDIGFVVRSTADVSADTDRAWRTLASPAEWWIKTHTFSGDSANLMLEPVAGGCFCEKLPLAKGAPKGQGGVQHMRVLYAEPGRALRLSGALGPLQSEAVTGTLTITMKPTARGTRLVFEYVVGGFMRYDVAQIGLAVDKVIAAQLAALAEKLGPLEAEAAVDRPAASQEQGPEPADAPGASAADALPVAETRAPADAAPVPILDRKGKAWSLPAPRKAGATSAPATPAPPKPAAPPRPGAAPAITPLPAPAPRATAPAVPPRPTTAKPVTAKPATAKPAGAKSVTGSQSGTAAAARGAASKAPAQKPADRDHMDANAAFDAALGGGTSP